jgi:uncharacterized protein
MRVVLDTNVLISAFISDQGSPAQLLALCHAGGLELLVSPDTLAELRRVLTYPRVRKRLSYTDEQINQYIGLLEEIGVVITPPSVARVVLGDADDDKFVALALAGGAQYLVSGDAHLLSVGRYQGITILKPAAFLLLWQALQQE